MISNGKFLVDSNVFIEAKNFAYNFNYCKLFWDFLLALHSKGLVYSINAVKKELCAKEDPLCKWVKEELHLLFLKVKSARLLTMQNLLIGP